MTETLRPRLTAAGLQAVFNAQSSGLQAVIAQVAAGQTGYAPALDAAGLATQTALVAERERAPLAQATAAGPRQIGLSFALDGPLSYWVREIGFFLDDGTLLAVWSDPLRALAWKAADVTLVLGFDLALGALPDGAVTIAVGSPPLELVITREMAVLGAAIANLQSEQLRQAARIRALSPDQQY